MTEEDEADFKKTIVRFVKKVIFLIKFEVIANLPLKTEIQPITKDI